MRRPIWGMGMLALALTTAGPARGQGPVPPRPCAPPPCGCGGVHAGAGAVDWYSEGHCVNGLYPSTPFVNPYQGNYYFRPYSYMMTSVQTRAAMAMGLDPREPYSDEIFERVYREIEGGKDKKPVGPAVEGPATGDVPAVSPLPRRDRDAATR